MSAEANRQQNFLQIQQARFEAEFSPRFRRAEPLSFPYPSKALLSLQEMQTLESAVEWDWRLGEILNKLAPYIEVRVSFPGSAPEDAGPPAPAAEFSDALEKGLLDIAVSTSLHGISGATYPKRHCTGKV